MNAEEVIKELEVCVHDFEWCITRCSKPSTGSFYDLIINKNDEANYKSQIREIKSLLNNILGENDYTKQIDMYSNSQSYNYKRVYPTKTCIQSIVGTIKAAISNIKKTSEMINNKQSTIRNATNSKIVKNNVFIIHGQDEAKMRELKEIIKDDFDLNPIVLLEKPAGGSKPLIDKFENYAEKCSFAIAVFTPDDKITNKNGETCFQARPNTIYELGWFCGCLGREKVLLLLKEGTSTFSDFYGIHELRFKNDIKEKLSEIEAELVECGLLSDKRDAR